MTANIHRMTNDEVRAVWFTPDGKSALDLADELLNDRDPWDSAETFIDEMFQALGGKREVQLPDDDPLHATYGDAVWVFDWTRDGEPVALLLDSDQAVNVLRKLCHAAALMDGHGTMAEELAPEVTAWEHEYGGDLSDHLPLGHLLVDKETSRDLPSHVIACWDGTRIERDPVVRGGDWAVTK